MSMSCKHGIRLGDRSVCELCNMERIIEQLTISKDHAQKTELEVSERAFNAEKRQTELESQLADSKKECSEWIDLHYGAVAERDQLREFILGIADESEKVSPEASKMMRDFVNSTPKDGG